MSLDGWSSEQQWEISPYNKRSAYVRKLPREKKKKSPRWADGLVTAVAVVVAQRTLLPVLCYVSLVASYNTCGQRRFGGKCILI
ncbi:jg26045 [Pararge aegeria aegeria]|uniref:Jg26045 protein n=1 Tax=Pararge aegeria aegeria TaxID=348720 RepID=A0A8S4QTY3_9NEOP|nr:jg26045 [Pararge aegeria aegeria]